ncbi:MAG: hypothetical protein QMC90_03215 [Dehalococcoidales bacterium]|nr:hypothetical protein [Dehalococcoidales bacterium]
MSPQCYNLLYHIIDCPLEIWPRLAERHKAESLCKLAKEYGASRKTVRRALSVQREQDAE